MEEGKTKKNMQRKFWSCIGAASAILIYSGVARPLGWVSESTMLTMMFGALGAISIYGGFNLAEKLGGFGALFVPRPKEPKGGM